MTTETTKGARTTDPETSHAAALAGDEERWNVHREQLLIAWYRAGPDGLNDEEAMHAAGLVGHYAHKRGGELREPHRGPMSWEARAGEPLITYDGRSRKGSSGRLRKVSVITPAGIDYVRRYLPSVQTDGELRAEIDRLRGIIERAAATAETGRRADVLDVLRDAGPQPAAG